ncbi:Variant SH3 domain-containing protein (fragment) [uncultured delta proteobacterium]|uniref:Variant SH3 domain-containing protein n=1 Tax=uncultured delta proteobacterium TaxID=34034 RepID=A0A212J8H2_9DELT
MLDKIFIQSGYFMKYIVIKTHRSEYPDPLSFRKGTLLTIGEKYDGPEAWEDWYFCAAPGHAGGWVPRRVIEPLGDGTGRALEDYSARELDVD